MRKHNRNKSLKYLLLAGTFLVFFSCSKQNSSSPSLEDGQSVVVTDLAGDTAAATATANAGDSTIASFKTLYFSLTTNGVVSITDSSQLQSGNWDLAFTGPYNSTVYVNNGGSSYSPGYGGSGLGAIIQVDSSYDQVTMAPADNAFTASAIANIGWDAGNGTGWFFYSLNNHICVPISGRTFLLRTTAGKYAKLQLVNIYKGNPSVVTNLFWPAPYLTFRYFVQQDGSTNLATK